MCCKLLGVPRHFFQRWEKFSLFGLSHGNSETMCQWWLLLVCYVTAICKFEGENMKSQILVNIRHRLVEHQSNSLVPLRLIDFVPEDHDTDDAHAKFCTVNRNRNKVMGKFAITIQIAKYSIFLASSLCKIHFSPNSAIATLGKCAP